MLVLWKNGTFSFRISAGGEKLGLVDLGGVRSTRNINVPHINKDLMKNFNEFSYFGKVEGKEMFDSY